MSQQSEKTEIDKLAKIFSQYGTLGPQALRSFKKMTGGENKSHAIIMDELNSLEKSVCAKNAVQYFDKNAQECERQMAEYILVPTGVYAVWGREIYFGFKRKDTKNGFSWYYGADYGKISDTVRPVGEQQNILEKPKNGSSISNIKAAGYMAEAVFDMLLIKSGWDKDNCKSLNSLLYMLECRIKHEIRAGKEINFIWNRDKTKVLYNTGLVDKYSNDIQIIQSVSEGNMLDKSVADSKTSIKKNGFDNFDGMKPVKLYNDIKELCFSAEMKDFDLINNRTIYHMLEERRERFPDSMKDISVDVLFQKLKSSLEIDLRMCNRDFKWALPIYNPKANKIQYMLPYHINNSVADSAELAVIVDKGDEFYEVVTVLNIDEAYMDAMTIGVPNCTWLSLG